MLTNNQVLLIGEVIPDHTSRYVSSSGGQFMRFVLRTSEVWYSNHPDARREHYEYHQVILREGGSLRLLSRKQNLIVAGQRLLVTGKLRYRLIKDESGKVTHCVAEVDADGIELLSLHPEAQVAANGVADEEQSA